MSILYKNLKFRKVPRFKKTSISQQLLYIIEN